MTPTCMDRRALMTRILLACAGPNDIGRTAMPWRPHTGSPGEPPVLR